MSPPTPFPLSSPEGTPVSPSQYRYARKMGTTDHWPVTAPAGTPALSNKVTNVVSVNRHSIKPPGKGVTDQTCHNDTHRVHVGRGGAGMTPGAVGTRHVARCRGGPFSYEGDRSHSAAGTLNRET